MRNSAPRSPVKWLIILAVLGLGGYAGYRYWKRPSQAPVGYQTAEVARGDVVQSVTANGSLTPVRLVEVGSQISGVITEIKADFNSRVKEGEVVAQIDPATYERALGQNEAELANSEAALELAQLNYDRAQELITANLISKSEFDEARVGLIQAKAGVKTRQANVERARVDLNRTTIYAPMDGIVITRRVEAGQTVAASMNAPVLFIIANDLAKMRIEAAVSEADVGGVEEEQTVEFTVDAFPGRPFRGRVEQVRFAPTTNQNVVTYTTVVAVDNQDLKLRPGMTANARIITAERRGVLTVPNTALRFRPPAAASIKIDTNAPPLPPAPAVALIENGPFAGLPVMPWQAGGERRGPTDQERAAYVATLTAEQKQKYEQAMAEMRARFAQGGGPGGGGPGGGGPGGGGPGGGGGFGGEGGGGGGVVRRAEPDGPKLATIHLIEKESLPMGGERTVLKPVSVKLGIGDGTNTEVLEGLTEGEVVATGTTALATSASTAPRNPLGSPFGGGRRGAESSPAQAMEPIIKLEDYRRTYRNGSLEVHAVRGVSLEIAPGEFVAVMGASGSGKSTMMNTIGCLDRPTGGRYVLDGVEIGKLNRDELADLRNRKLGFVFQGFNLLARTSALENVELPMLYSRPAIPAREQFRRALKALEMVGLADRADHHPNQLSGGQQQRVAIARALVNEPRVLLADEPTGNLDSRTGIEVMGVFQALNDQGITIVMVTHELDIASYSKRKVVMRDGLLRSDEPMSNRLLAPESLARLDEEQKAGHLA